MIGLRFTELSNIIIETIVCQRQLGTSIGHRLDCGLRIADLKNIGPRLSSQLIIDVKNNALTSQSVPAKLDDTIITLDGQTDGSCRKKSSHLPAVWFPES